jgi:hypothetical protein
MPKDNELRRLRNLEIIKDYEKLDKEGYRYAVIVERLGKKWFLKPRTIEGILRGE